MACRIIPGPFQRPRHRAANRLCATGLPLLLGLAALAGGGCKPADQAPDPSPAPGADAGTKRMAQRLERLAAQANPRDNVYLNRRRAAAYERVSLEGLDLPQQVDLKFRLALEHLRAGQSERAITTLESLHPLLPGLPPDQRGRHQWMTDWFLGLAHMRLAEQQNCVARHTSQACLMPIGPQGVHTQPAGAEGAVRYFTRALEQNPRDLPGIWLLNIAYMSLGQHPDAVPRLWFVPSRVFDSEGALPRFRDVAPACGVAAQGLAGGAVMEDLDGDGLLDLMCSSWGLRDPLRLFRNQGDGTFEDLPVPAGLTGGLNLVQADYDNDGDRDVLVLRGAWFGKEGRHPNSLLRNDGQGRFTDVTESAGLLSFRPTQAAAWADYNRDGYLDLFIGNESDGTNGFPSELYQNNGDGTFTECAASRGLDQLGFVKGIAWGDYDNDGWPDLFVSRLGEPNRLLRNPGPAAGPGQDPAAARRFTDVTAKAGVAEPLDSFPCWFFDYDNDGWLDLFVASYSWVDSMEKVAADYLGLEVPAAKPRLYRNRGDGTFADVTRSVGLDRTLVAMGANYGDLDNDGYLDLYIGTGEPNLGTLIPNRMFRNQGGTRFLDVTTAGGFGHLQKGHGIAFGDLDQDGDQDIYAVLGGAYEGDGFQNALFRNPGPARSWITLRLVGTQAHRDAIGARLHLRVSSGPGAPARSIHRRVGSGGSFGASSLQQEIGLGDADAILSLTIHWPSASPPQTLTNLPLNRIVTLREGEQAFTSFQPTATPLGSTP